MGKRNRYYPDITPLFPSFFYLNYLVSFIAGLGEFLLAQQQQPGTWINTAVVYLHVTHTHCPADILVRKEERIPAYGNHSHVAVVRLLCTNLFLSTFWQMTVYYVGMEPS